MGGWFEQGNIRQRPDSTKELSLIRFGGKKYEPGVGNAVVTKDAAGGQPGDALGRNSKYRLENGRNLYQRTSEFGVGWNTRIRIDLNLDRISREGIADFLSPGVDDKTKRFKQRAGGGQIMACILLAPRRPCFFTIVGFRRSFDRQLD